MAADLSIEALSLIVVDGFESNVSFILTVLKAEFLKKSISRIEFVY